MSFTGFWGWETSMRCKGGRRWWLMIVMNHHDGCLIAYLENSDSVGLSYMQFYV